jgi:hypothetical protein
MGRVLGGSDREGGTRLLHDPDRYIERFGRRNYELKLADCLWHVYRLVGKLSSRIYVLSAGA